MPLTRSVFRLIYGLFAFGFIAFIAFGIAGLPGLIVVTIAAGAGLVVERVKDEARRKQLRSIYVIVTVVFILIVLGYLFIHLIPYMGGLPTAN